MNEFLLQPNNIYSEELILASFIQDDSIACFGINNIDASDFYKEEHKEVFNHIKTMVDKEIPIDLVSLFNQINKSKSSLSQDFLLELYEKTGSSANLEYHIQEIKEKGRLRKLIKTASDIISNASSLDANSKTLLTNLETEVDKINLELDTEEGDLPGFETASEGRKELKKVLIDKILRIGHKMIISGASKAGKSFALIQLAISIAEGLKWFNYFQCQKGKVVYINFEIDKDTFNNRVHDIYEANGIPKTNIDDIIIWPLRGEEANINKLVKELRRRLKNMTGIKAIILDPLYKILDGDENDAAAMTRFGNKLDKIAKENGASVIYCHHHTKGDQFGKKAQDRSSGSGVLSRDPDAILDLIELEASKVAVEDVSPHYFKDFLYSLNSSIDPSVVLNDCILSSQYECKRYIKDYCENANQNIFLLTQMLNQKTKELNKRKAFKVESSLREFESFEEVNIWFDWPTHKFDEMKELADCYPIGDPRNKKRNTNKFMKKRTEPKTAAFKNFKSNLSSAFDQIGGNNLDSLIKMVYGDLSKDNISKFHKNLDSCLDFNLSGNREVIKETIDFN